MSNTVSYTPDVNAAVTQHADTVYKIALARTGNQNDANDVFQEVFLRLVMHVDKISSDEHMKHWLIRVTINCCNKHFKLWRSHTTDIPDLSVPFEPEEDDIYQAVLKLPPKYCNVIHLFYYEQLSIKEISEVLKLKETAVKSQLSRGRDKLREMLKGASGYGF